MQIDEYQKRAVSTAIYPHTAAVTYPALGLVGEAGEVAEKIKKVIRDNEGIFTRDKREEIAKELGDVLWYIAALSRDLDIPMEDIALANLHKLASRKQRGKLQGSGDNR